MGLFCLSPSFLPLKYLKMGRGRVFQVRLIIMDRLLVLSRILRALNHDVAVHMGPLLCLPSYRTLWLGKGNVYNLYFAPGSSLYR